MTKWPMNALNLVALSIVMLICGGASAKSAYTDWLPDGNGYDPRRFALVDKIPPQSVSRAGVVCHVGLGDDGPFEATPVVVRGIIYLTTGHTTVAVDATHCRPK